MQKEIRGNKKGREGEREKKRKNLRGYAGNPPKSLPSCRVSGKS